MVGKWLESGKNGRGEAGSRSAIWESGKSGRQGTTSIRRWRQPDDVGRAAGAGVGRGMGMHTRQYSVATHAKEFPMRNQSLEAVRREARESENINYIRS